MRSSTPAARDSCRRSPPDPGTKSRVMTRATGRARPLRLRVTSDRWTGHRAQGREAARVLQGGDQRQGRLGALVEVRRRRREAVEAAAGLRVPHAAGRRRCRRGTSRGGHPTPSGHLVVAGRRRAPARRRRPAWRPRSAAGRSRAAVVRARRRRPGSATGGRPRVSWSSSQPSSVEARRRPGSASSSAAPAAIIASASTAFA